MSKAISNKAVSPRVAAGTEKTAEPLTQNGSHEESTPRMCGSCNKELLPNQWHTCHGCGDPIHGKVLADLSHGVCVVTRDPLDETFLFCKTCTELRSSEASEALVDITTNTADAKSRREQEKKKPIKEAMEASTSTSKEESTSNKAALTSNKGASTSNKGASTSKKALSNVTQSTSKSALQNPDTIKEKETKPKLAAKDAAALLAELRKKHGIPTFPAGIKYEDFSVLKKLFTLVAFSTIKQDSRMNKNDLYVQITERYELHVILIYYVYSALLIISILNLFLIIVTFISLTR